MIVFLLLATIFLVPSVLSAPAELVQLSERQGGYYWSNWSEGNGNWNCRNEAGGKYSVTWSGKNGGFVCGKGWRNGGNRSVPHFLILPQSHAPAVQPKVSLTERKTSSTVTNAINQGSQLLRHLHAQRPRLPRHLRLDTQPAHRILHRRILRRSRPGGALDTKRKLLF